MILRRLPFLIVALLLGCSTPPAAPPPPDVLDPLPALPRNTAAATRVNGRLGTVDALAPPVVLPGTVAAGVPRAGEPAGDIALVFAEADLREVVAQILGTILGVNYTIDPAVHGTVTLRTAQPLTRAQLVSALQAVLAQNGATLAQVDGLYRISPVGAGGAQAGGAQAGGAVGSVVVPLRYAAAEELAKVLQPFVGTGGRIAADPGRNALIVASDADTRDTLVGMIRNFDIDVLAGQSYALFPVVAGGVKDFAAGLQEAFRTQNGGATGAVRVVPMERVNAVMVVAPQPAQIEAARRVYGLFDRARRQTVRTWHITYLQNSDSSDVAFVLQSALTPNNITAQPRGNQPGLQMSGSGGGRGLTGLGASGGGSGLSGLGGAGGVAAGNSGSLAGGGGGLGMGAGANPGSGALATAGGGATATTVTANPLLGGLDTSGGGTAAPDGLRIVPNDQNNALLIFATLQEQDAVEAILRKIDILPRQVRIDATIAEVTLNDQLQYGTQFFFRSGGINGALSNANATIIDPKQALFSSSFPGFFLGGSGRGGAPFAINALQSVTTVNVLSSPQLLVLDNQPARLQVGNLVPYLAQTSQSTLSTGAPVINSINYQQTGVIMQVRPRVNSGGLVTLDIAQEVSDVNPDSAVSGINSPTFLERNVTSRVVVQDGQTIGLAGLIRDSSSRGNEGLPWLKDVPVLGLLAGKQDNTRTRTELLILITPHVVQDQRDARALTEDLRDQLINAAMVPQVLRATRPSGVADPSEPLRKKLRLQP